MAKLNELSREEREHWELHLNREEFEALQEGRTTHITEISRIKNSIDDLPPVTRPANLHSWMATR